MRPRNLAGVTTVMVLWLTGCGGDTLAPAGQGTPASRGPVSQTLAPAIAVSPTSLSFLVYAFRPTYNPPGKTLRITNAGGGTLTWTASDNAYWLKLAHTSGTAPTTVTVRAYRTAIPIGLNGYRPRSLEATITISGGRASNTPLTVPVRLTISYAH